MFTGLVEELGECQWLRRSTDGTQITVRAPHIEKRIRTGDSVAVNGCCLTVSSHRKESLTFDLLEETLSKTNLRNLRPGAGVNLERALAADGRLGGHFVQGHIDGTIAVRSVTEKKPDLRLEFDLPSDFARYVAYKGSVAINGVSLTVAEVLADSFVVWIIPHTRQVTNLGKLAAGDLVNFECDILAKYAERILAGTRETSN
ncbi:MAG: riboflavin synthase [Terrimicrobiaceae bacterium]|nr:riboflavin synthase [Terrimicrobiaceae bacterium]